MATFLLYGWALAAAPVIGRAAARVNPLGRRTMPIDSISPSDAQTMQALRRTLSLAAARQVVSSSNLANLNTPGYKAQEVDFDETLDDRLDGRMRLALTDARHLGVGAADVSGDHTTREVADAAARRDGNTVQIDRELLNMSRAAGEFARAQTALAAKFRIVRYAINETR